MFKNSNDTLEIIYVLISRHYSPHIAHVFMKYIPHIPQNMHIFCFCYDNIDYISIIPQRKISFLKLSKYCSWLTYDCSKIFHHVINVNMLKLYKIKLFVLCCYLLWNQDWLTYKCSFKSCTTLIHLDLHETFQMDFLHDCMLTADNFNIPPSVP